MYTDLKTPFEATYRIAENPPGFDYTADCHGISFAEGKFWIDNDQAQIILNDEYNLVPYNNKREGDIATYYNIKNELVHSLTLKQTSNGLLAYGKGGYTPKPYLQEIENGWKYKPFTIKIYRKK